MTAAWRHRFWIRLTHWEFWPTWVVYLPVLCCYPFWALRARSLFFYANVNPGMTMGGLYGASKKEALDAIPATHKPTTLSFEPRSDVRDVMVRMKKCGVSFPVVVKPDQGERGKGIEVVHNEGQLKAAVASHPTPFLVQPYLDLPFEAGVFYVRLPHEPRGRVTSLVVKGFLQVTGNGQDSLETLALQNMRAALIWEPLKKTIPTPHRILDAGEVVTLEAIGNHSRGTAFLDGNHLINDAVEAEAEHLARSLPGFYYGRFDLRAPSEEAFQAGEGWQLLEVNGASAEPAHIYQEGASLLAGVKSLVQHWSWACDISRQNRRHHPHVRRKEAVAMCREWRMVKATRWS